MRLATDYIHPTPNRGRCRVRLYLPDEAGDAPVVIVSELANNPGMSVTNCIERIAAEVIRNHDFSDQLFPVWIEHYEEGARGTPEDQHTFDLVTFSDEEILGFHGARVEYVTLGEPSWKPLDRAAVEALVGEEV